MGKKDDQFLTILDIDKVFSADDVAVAAAMSQAGETRTPAAEPAAPVSSAPAA